jgi:hypothetical protein
MTTLEKSCLPDSFFYDIIHNSKSLSDSSKKFYIRRLTTLVNEICIQESIKDNVNIKKSCSINEIITKPHKIEKILDNYNQSLIKKKKEKKTLGIFGKESYIASIKSLFNHNTELKNDNIELFKKWDQLHLKFKEPIEHKYLSNEPSEKEKKGFIEYDEIVKIRDKIIHNKANTLKRLLLFMYTAIPPLRADYDCLKIYKKTDKIKDPNDGNYLILNSSNNSKIILNNYKTANKYHQQKIDIPIMLFNEITQSLKLLPRQYLFITNSNEPFNTKNSYIQWANRLLKSTLNNKFITLTSFRHIYISRRDLCLESKSGLEQQKVAKAMGHSIGMQKRYNYHTYLENLSSKNSEEK